MPIFLSATKLKGFQLDAWDLYDISYIAHSTTIFLILYDGTFFERNYDIFQERAFITLVKNFLRLTIGSTKRIS